MARSADFVDDAVLSGQVPDETDDLAPLAALARALRAQRDAEPVPPMGAELMATIEDLCGPDGGAAHPPVARPAEPTRGRRARWLVGGVVAVLATGGLGVAGALPAPVQRAVANTAGHLGVELPRPGPLPAPAVGPPTTVPPVAGGAPGPHAPASVPSVQRQAPSVSSENDGGDRRGSEGDGPGGSPQTPPSTVPGTAQGDERGDGGGNRGGSGDDHGVAPATTTTTAAPGSGGSGEGDNGGSATDGSSHTDSTGRGTGDRNSSSPSTTTHPDDD